MIDPVRLAELRARWDDPGRAKYLDIDHWFDVNRRRAAKVGLDAGPPRRVLDLGCGCGYFLHVCGELGHEAIGIDRLERQSLYTEMRELLGVRWIPHTIRAFDPIPDVGKVDVLTAHMVCFNGHRKRPWGPREWEWLLDTIGASVVYLELNEEPDGTLFTSGLREMFRARGAAISGCRVSIGAGVS